LVLLNSNQAQAALVPHIMQLTNETYNYLLQQIKLMIIRGKTFTKKWRKTWCMQKDLLVAYIAYKKATSYN